jgi:hypothetical protein
VQSRTWPGSIAPGLGLRLTPEGSRSLQARTRISRYTIADGAWEAHLIAVGDSLGAIAVGPRQARSFFNTNHVDATACPSAGGHYPSGRNGVCSFRF